MPLKLRKRGEIWHYFGTVAGRRLRGSTKTALKDEAEHIANEAERRALKGRRDPGSVLTFAQAAIEYRKVHGEPRYLVGVEDYWKDTLVKDITRGALKRAAVAILPGAKGAYRNRAVIVPTSAVINFAASLELCPPFRPERFQETKAVREPATWAWVQAFMQHSSPHLGALACFMFLTGARISEALDVQWRDIDLSAARVRIRMGKAGGQERLAHMPPVLVAELAMHPRGLDRPGETVFRFRKNGRLYTLLKKAKTAAKVETDFHTFRHTWATWMRRYGKLDTKGLMATQAWKDEKSAARYQHVVVSEEMTRADLLPAPKRGKSVERG